MVYYKGEPFRAGFAWYEIYKKRWEYTTEKYALTALKDAKLTMETRSHIWTDTVKRFWESIDWSQFEIIELGIVNVKPINIKELQ